MVKTCIMEVRPGQRSSTIAQAMAHNLSTIERDLDMFKPLLEARGEHELLATIEEGHQHMKAAYQHFLDCFVAEIHHEVEHGHDHDHGDHEHGSERVEHAHTTPEEFEAELLAQARHDAALARRFETR